ncbi:hypothetical protein LTR70_006635 [Exophiala xenobiotica]|uniref:Xylanolytic transcriptional activator regulatory domain-containing protein n=1 Tax=Lithohypha guttulata TaxID=1690604 RepID=A0ABR0KQB2_9EURO|nr:hypothetical protein LTR24_000366 [Lithohypha guttulata]KAK5315644.1 hypothetical protein LTR70_006635 [Exophiala xenobiotica]
MENGERDEANSSIPSTRASSTESPEATQSRLLLNSKGERFLRGTLRYHMGSSAFTEANTKDIMLEVEMTDNQLGTIPELSDADEAELIRCYLEATSGILGLNDQNEPSTQFYQNTIDDHTAENLIILAIGAQCRGRPSDIQLASNCFKHGRSIAFGDMLINPSISMIKVFLLMSFYMLGACRRNAAFMYLGVSAKAACALGLHTKDYYRNLPHYTTETRQALWKSLFILDTIVSSVLGRPSSLPIQELEGAASIARFKTSTPEHCKAALEASYGATTYLSSLIQQSPGKKTASIDSTERLLGGLKTWSQSLHHSLRQLASPTGDRKLLIGNSHIGCIYYFTVMLSTRPFFISHNIAQLQKAKPPASNGTRPFVDYERVSKLAQVCLDAAITLANLTHRVQSQNGFLNNMCLVKAFVFAAGLLIGFSLFSSDSTDPDTQNAYSNAQTVLQQLSLLSPQAKHYHEILNDFSEAIGKYHRQKLNKKRRATNQYLDHIFDLESNTQSQNISGETGQQQYLSPVSGDGTILGTSTGDAFMTGNDIDFRTDLNFNAMMEIYDPDNLPLVWDDFGFA